MENNFSGKKNMVIITCNLHFEIHFIKMSKFVIFKRNKFNLNDINLFNVIINILFNRNN